MKRPWRLFPAVLAIVTFGCVTFGCASTGKPGPVPAGSAARTEASGADLKTRLDQALRSKAGESRIVEQLGTFSLENYDIQDPGTFWGHRAVAAAGASYSEYYFTYRNNYVILLLKDLDELHHACIDARVFPRRSPDYELATGRVQVDGRLDEEVVVLVNKKWTGNQSTDILAAFKPNVERGRIEKLQYASIVMYREE